MEEPREDRVEEAKWRIRTGYYDLPEILEEFVDQLIQELDQG